MQQTTLWEGNTCPLCESKGINSSLKFFRLNLREAALLCKRKKCPFPLSTNYPDIFVRVGPDGNIIPGSQSERGWQHEGEADSDDSPYMSDASEESVKFPDIVPEVKSLHNFSSENTNEKGAMEVDAFDINSIDFETDDSLDTFKLRNEITSLEMEITKSVENMKSVLPHVNCKNYSVLNTNTEKCINSDSVAAKTSATADDKVCTDIFKELDISGTSYMKMDENGVEWCDYRKSGDIILREHDPLTGIPESFEITQIGEELTNCVQQSDVNTPVSDEIILNHKQADVQNNNNRNFRDGGCTDDGDHGDGIEGVKSTINGNIENQLDEFTTVDPKPSILVIHQDIKKAVGNDLSMACELHSESVTNESVTFIKDICESEICDNKEVVESSLPRKCELLVELASSESVTNKDNDCRKEMCNNKEMVITCKDHKNSDNNEEKQLFTVSMLDTLNVETEPSVLTSLCMKSTVGCDSPVKHELLVELTNSESVTIKKDNDFKEEMCGDEEVFIIDNNHKTSNYSDNVVEQVDTVFMADTSNPKPEPSVLLTSQCIKSAVGNSLPGKCELIAELVGVSSVSIKTDNDCVKEKDGNKEMVITSDDHNNSDTIAEKQLNTIPKADTSKTRPDQSVLLTPQKINNTIGNNLAKKCELVGTESVPVKKANDCKKTFDNKEIDIIFKDNDGSDVCEIVAIEGDISSTAPLNDSTNYEVINLQLKFCNNQGSSGGSAGRKTTKVRHNAQNTVVQYGKKSSAASSDSEIFRCTTNNAPSSVSEGDKTWRYRNSYARKTKHSENCVCFLCSESNKRGITSHLDRALADLFPEEYSTEKHLTERDLPTEKEVMRDLFHYMTGSSSLQNCRSPKKRKRLFHL